MNARRKWPLLLAGPMSITALTFACGGRTLFDGETVVPPTAARAASVPPPAPSPPPVVDAAPPAPPAPPPRAELKVGRIEINEKVQFDVGKATIRDTSNALLDEIAQVIKANGIKKIRIEGHSSSEGDARANLKLSDDRAKSVVAALESRGIAKGVLVAKGFGSTVPLDRGTTEEALEKNRRVELVILDPLPAGVDGGAK